MDGELMASDKARFSALKSAIDADLSDRRDWFARAEKNRTERFKRQNTAKPVYDGAPNLVDPLIDDMVRELKQSCVTVLWQAPRLAQFIGLDPVAVEYAEAAEAVFDFHLRHGCKTRARVSQIVDDELTFGFGVAKLVEAPGRGVLPVPDFIPVSPLSVVVPTATLEIGQAERVCHMMRYTVAEFRRAATANGWDSAVAELAITKAAERRNAAAAGDRGEARARYRDGSLNDSGGGVEVWEIFYETSDAGRRVCSLAPDVPDRPLDDRPWT